MLKPRKELGGALLVYSKQVQILPVGNHNDFNQYCSFKVGKEKNHLYLPNTVYSLPGSSKDNDDKLKELIKIVETNSVLLRDFNIPGVDWRRRMGEVMWREIVEVVQEEGMEQLIEFPTHIKSYIL